jgi:hypothetical protein
VVRLKPDVILATAIDTAVAVRKLTSTIPVVSGALADAVRLGLITSETRPEPWRIGYQRCLGIPIMPDSYGVDLPWCYYCIAYFAARHCARRSAGGVPVQNDDRQGARPRSAIHNARARPTR